MSRLIPREGAAEKKEALPVSVLVQLYRFLRWTSEEERLELARWLTSKPKLFNAWFDRSLKRNNRFVPNAAESFCGIDRKPLAGAGAISEIRSGRDLAALIAQTSQWWQVVEAPELEFRYIDHELPPFRKTGRVRFEDGLPNASGMAADLLLVRRDGTPIVAELKAATSEGQDTDAVLALLQSLALTAQLASKQQRERLATSYPKAKFRIEGKLDTFVILVKPGVPARSTNQADLYRAARELAAALHEQPAVSNVIRHLKFIEAQRDVQLTFHLPRRDDQLE